uniref:Large ribosomal subunit protein bL20c n=1 Tax=Gracilaria caudata TaxID=2572395 RepID=A0A345U6P2_9FLOR|nr:ribosomal protein L20 [Gracilaria caudata]YP_010196172.1 ribosomal protein L20 [Gracilaria caudata]AXI96128.1 ribosomal protein L20 [Gracilaria caudata]UAD83569.1 ribosomal protein L20 [Gracilaria caudata]
MTRVKRGNVARKRRKKILKLAKGFQGSHSILFRTAKQQVLKALKYSYIDRKKRKRSYRSLWIVRINAAVRSYGVTYSEFIQQLKKKNIALNRKMLSQLSILDNNVFQNIIKLCELT